MTTKTVTVQVEVDVNEVFSDLCDSDLIEECESRGIKFVDDEEPLGGALLDRAYNELRQGEIGAATRDYIYQKLGRIL